MRFILILLFAMAAFSGFAQGNKTKMTATSVSGVMTPAKSFFLLQHHGMTDTVKVAQDGSFKLNIEQPDANYYTVVIGKQNMTIYLLPADQFKMTLNGNMPSNNPKFEGSSAPYCNFLVNQKLNDKLSAQYGRLASLEPAVFQTEVDTIIRKMQKYLDVESAKNKFISPFVASEKLAIDYIYANACLLYKYNYEESARIGLPENIARAAVSGDLNNESMRYTDQFNGYANNLINYMANAKYDKDANEGYLKYCELKVDEVCSRVTSQKNRDVIFQSIMPQILQEAGAQDIRKVVAKFEGCCSDANLKKRVKGIMAQYASLYPGEIAPDAVCFDSTGQVTRLSDHRGKVLYIDTWATWCGPCKKEIPELQKLEAEFHGKNVEFISISTDQNLAQWENFLAKQQMTGLQLHQSENFDESVSKLYMVNSIPRFIVIDEAGKIVSADAPRPSSGAQIRNMLNEVLAD